MPLLNTTSPLDHMVSGTAGERPTLHKVSRSRVHHMLLESIHLCAAETSWALPLPSARGDPRGFSFAPVPTRRSNTVAVRPRVPLPRGRSLQAPQRAATSPAAVRSAAADPAETVAAARRLFAQKQYLELAYEFRRAADAGSVEGALCYGMALSRGYGVRRSPAEAVRWFVRAAGSELGEGMRVAAADPWSLEAGVRAGPGSRALLELGTHVANGWGCVRDEVKGCAIVERAAALGEVQAMEQLGEWWAVRQGKRKKDMARAAAWLRAAEARGAVLVGQSWIHEKRWARQ